MNVADTEFADLKVLTPIIHRDDRGYFFESYNQNRLLASSLKYNWLQDNEAKSVRGVLRGLHYQTGHMAQAKLVRVIVGRVQDVVVDLRPSSASYGKYYSIILSDENRKQLLIPRGFAHGYLTLSDFAIFSYKCDNNYSPKHEAGIRYDDTTLKIQWQMSSNQFVISEKDAKLPPFGAHTPIALND